MMTDLNYKKYSLENLENWLYDAMSAGEATPQEIYDVIVNVVKDNYYTYKKQTSEAYELLTLLNGNSIFDINYPNQHYDYVSCYSNDKSSECQNQWSSFWNETNYSQESQQYTEEEMNAMCDKASSDEEKEKCREYNLRESEYYDKRAQLDSKTDHVTRWVLPVQVDGLSGECYVQFPDDLLERASLKEGDMVNWIDRKDGSFEMRKVSNHP